MRMPRRFVNRARPLAVQFADATQQAFDADEVAVWIPGGVFRQERSVTAAEFHFQWLRAGKKIIEPQAFKNGRQVVDQ